MMYPHERSLVKQLADKPFALIGVNSDGSSEKDLKKIREIVKEKNLTWRSFQDDGGETKISDKWRVQGWPTVYILDAEGKIRLKGHGDFDSVIEECLAEMGHEVKIRGVGEEEDEDVPEPTEDGDDKDGDSGVEDSDVEDSDAEDKDAEDKDD